MFHEVVRLSDTFCAYQLCFIQTFTKAVSEQRRQGQVTPERDVSGKLTSGKENPALE